MEQLNLFRMSRASANLPGDKASTNQAVWVVEMHLEDQDVWLPVEHGVFHSREDARDFARDLRDWGEKVRVLPYKACLDSQGRVNRQVTSERLDY